MELSVQGPIPVLESDVEQAISMRLDVNCDQRIPVVIPGSAYDVAISVETEGDVDATAPETVSVTCEPLEATASESFNITIMATPGANADRVNVVRVSASSEQFGEVSPLSLQTKLEWDSRFSFAFTDSQLEAEPTKEVKFPFTLKNEGNANVRYSFSVDGADLVVGVPDPVVLIPGEIHEDHVAVISANDAHVADMELVVEGTRTSMAMNGLPDATQERYEFQLTTGAVGISTPMPLALVLVALVVARRL